jgi:CRISPR system Cascade subunit CasC
MFIELHMIQNFGPSCLNRDDTNTPKDCQFGGYRRARISSQCLKRAIREYFKENISELKDKLGVRTRLLPKRITEILIDKGKDQEIVSKVVKNVLKKFDFKIVDDDEKTDVLLFLNEKAPQKIAEFILDNWEDMSKSKISKKKVNPIIDEVKSELSADIALFGRMVATNTDLNVDAACYMAHALSTHKVDMEMDFYTALDDLQEETESGAGMMGIIMYNSSCFYRYSVLDYDQLIANLQENQGFSTDVLKSFLKASINAIPTGKQTSMTAFNKPDFMMVNIRSDQPWSLTNAFAKPVKIAYKDTDLIEESILRIDNYLNDMVKLYGTPNDFEVNYCIVGDRETTNLKEIGTQHQSIDKMIEVIGESVDERYSTSA